jgi:hypothetical protein
VEWVKKTSYQDTADVLALFGKAVNDARKSDAHTDKH